MTRQIIIPLIALFISGAANASQKLCTTTTFEAFGEPEQTVRDCADPYESFWVSITINGTQFMPQGLGLAVPQTTYIKSADKSQFITVQVTKIKDGYNVRFQAMRNGQSVNWMGAMQPGEQRTMDLNGQKVNVRFERQKYELNVK